jgi:predicted transcriptional regulator of viral defense system
VSDVEEIRNLVDDLGMITTKDVVAKNQSKEKFYNYLKRNNFEKISRGIYASKDAWVDPLLVAHMRCPKAVISHDAALHYYGLVDREPLAPTLTIYSGYNTSRLKAAGYKVFYVKKEYLGAGKVEVVDFDGNTIPMYDMERTMCDLLRNRNSFEIQDFNAALKAYARKKEKNITKLFEYSRMLRVEKVMRTYMEVLL